MARAHRIASLLASGTELCCALGAGDELVARSHECDFPEWVKTLPVASAPTFPVEGTSLEIDAHVRRLMAARAPLYAVDEALLTRLAPDVIITQTHCEVCAVSPADVERAGVLCREQVVALNVGSLDGTLEGFLAVGKVIDREAQAAALVAALRARVAAARAKEWARRPRIVCLEWIDPPFAMGNWGPELVALAGGTNQLGTDGKSGTLSWDAIQKADPDVLLIAPCGFGVARAWADMPSLAARPGWRELTAVRTGQVVVADGNLYFNRSSPSLFDTVDLLAEILHPDEIEPRFAHAWVRWHG